MFLGEPWIFWAGIVVLVSFMPLTVYSYRQHRLPEKKKEYERLMARLKEEDIEDPETISILEEKYTFRDYLLPLAFVTTFSVLGFFVLFTQNANVLLSGIRLGEGDPASYAIGGVVAIGMAFLGAYVWSIQYIFRRLVTVDLPPGAYYNVGTRMVFASFVALVFYHFVSALPSGEVAAAGASIDIVPDVMLRDMIPVVAFITGIFPQRALNYMVERFRFAAAKRDKQADSLPLDMLEGIGPFHKVRLSELGIDNVQNLVEASLVELILRTPFRPRQLIDWMGQGRLCLHFKSDVKKLRAAGVRTIPGFRIIGNEDKLDVLAASTDIDITRLELVYQIIRESEAVERLSRAERCLHAV